MSTQADRLAQWLESKTGICDAKVVKRLTGGNANITSLVDSSDGPLVLRHPPPNVVSDRAAAGIAREFQFVSALAGHAPVAHPIAFSEDSTILGVPFSVHRFVAGVAITDKLPEAYPKDIGTINELGVALIDALASVHAIDPVPRGLGCAAKAELFVTRQISRWRDVRSKDEVRDLPMLEKVGNWLSANVPQPEAVRIVHCDYHLDNVLMDHSHPKVNAILDWEMATLADPLVDLGLVTALWNRDESQTLGFSFVQRVSNNPGAITGDELAKRWADTTGLSIDHIAYFQAFALWRLAAIVEGAYVLFSRGQVKGDYERGLERDVPALLEAASRIAFGRMPH